MKNNIKKQILLLSAFAMLLSIVPMQAEEAAIAKEMGTAPVAVQEEVAAKRGFFSGWTSGALHRRMREAMHDLDREWKPFIKCVKEEKGGCFQQAKTVRNLIGTILALIAVTATGIFVARRGRGRGRVPQPMFSQAENNVLTTVRTYLISPDAITGDAAIEAINAVSPTSAALDTAIIEIKDQIPSFVDDFVYQAIQAKKEGKPIVTFKATTHLEAEAKARREALARQLERQKERRLERKVAKDIETAELDIAGIAPEARE